MIIAAVLADASAGGQIEQIANTFGVDWPHLVSQIISFGIVCFLLQRFAYRPILRMLEERRQQIAQGIAEREKIKNELAQAEQQRQEILVRADTEASKVIEEAHAAAARVREKETQKAIAEAEQILVKSREAAQEERNRMLRELKQELGILVIQATSMATRKILTLEDQRRMAEETLKQVAQVA
jgi:F-type H+-transporting ATPase subunit b